MKKIILSAIMLTGMLTFAQESKLNISGTVDVYAKTNLNADHGVTPTSSFANQSGFALGMANLIASYDGAKSGVVADLVFGPRGNDAVFGSTVGSTPIVNQLYVYYNVTESTTLTLGNFNTFLGYEVISPAANFNYSTSYLFSYGPFSHTGIKLDYAATEDLSFMLAAMNGTDNTDYNITGNVVLGGQIGFKGQYLNLIYGNSGAGDQFQIDYTGGFDLSDAFYVGINASYNTTDAGEDDPTYYGAALYLQYAVSDTFSLGLRPEYFYEENGFGAINEDATDMEGDIFALTLTGNIKLDDSLTLIPEIRMDSASEASFAKDGVDEKSMSSILVAAVYSF
ncbi:outer membrane beta-barrel protein [Wenyingzhuangia sp. 2_MG-2023]|nr:outer membrane beta-barrel protein [Wenyingzhuangia sp. 2_MG-2023]MDO6736936.1 outer membrane beta-barrel protein [Wenyingzhuangia sp. 2_MG-2023]